VNDKAIAQKNNVPKNEKPKTHKIRGAY